MGGRVTSYYLLLRYRDGEIGSNDRLLNSDSDATMWASYVRDAEDGVVMWQLYALGGSAPRLVTQGDTR